MMNSRRFLFNRIVVTALAAVYFAAGKFGLRLACVSQSATAVWPPTGIALGASKFIMRSIEPQMLLDELEACLKNG